MLFSKKKKDLSKMALEMNAQRKIDEENTMMCEKGLKLEKSGNIDEAIIVYEELLKRKFDGTCPYYQLCCIYHKRKMFNEELRVIRSLRNVTSKTRYNSENKFRWYDKRYDELKAKK